MNADIANAMFEFGGAAAVVPSIYSIIKTRQAQGIAVTTAVFFASWGYWNMFYYPSLNQPYSMIGACVLSVVNTTWLYLIIKYRAQREEICVSSGA